MVRFFKRQHKIGESRVGETSDTSTIVALVQKRTRESHDDAQFDRSSSEIIVDPGLRKPIADYDVAIRDQLREYLLRGPCQPIGHNFSRKLQGKDQRSFQGV